MPRRALKKAAGAPPRSARADLAARVAAAVAPVVRPGARLVVGLSGGLDSVALLDCLARARGRLRVRLAALHVNHQLSAEAPRWEAFCRGLCRRLRVPFRSVRVRIEAAGRGLEAAAREARYRAYAQARADYVVLAHHLDDQAETLLVQLLRGAGAKGLAAMPALRRLEAGVLPVQPASRSRGAAASSRAGQPAPAILRPLLEVPRSEIEAYARARALEWVEDPSNADLARPRNFLRHRVLPLIAERFPSYRVTIGRAARHLAEAAELLDELAALDAEGWLENGALGLEALRRLPPARARNLLRYFLARCGVTAPRAERLEEALRQALGARSDAQVAVELGGAQLRRYADKLFVVRAVAAVPARYEKRWRGERRLALPELGGVLAMERVRGAGVSLARLRARAVTVRVRCGGEWLQPDCGRPRRSLKNLLQEARIPPWERGRLPLLYSGARLVWVAGIGTDCAFQARPGEPGVRPVWMKAPCETRAGHR